jgi:hypothetical protein
MNKVAQTKSNFVGWAFRLVCATSTINVQLLFSYLMWQENNNPYRASSSYYNMQSPPSASANTPLQFYTGGSDQSQFYHGSRSSLEGHAGAQGSIPQQGVQSGYGGNIAPSAGGWWTAFGTGGFEGEPPLLEGKHSPSCSARSILTTYHRTWNKLFSYTRKIINGAESATAYRRTYHGRCRLGGSSTILLLVRNILAFREST